MMMGIQKRFTVGSPLWSYFVVCIRKRDNRDPVAHLRSWARLSPLGPAQTLRGFSSWNVHVWAGSRVRYPRVPVTPIPILCCNHPRLRNPPRKTWIRAGKGSLNWSSARQKKKRVNKKGGQRLDAVQRRNKTHKSCFISSPSRVKVRKMRAG